MSAQLKKTIPPKYNYFLLEHKLLLKQIKRTYLKILISDSVGILCIAESKVDESFLNTEIELQGFKKPHRLDVTPYRETI